MYEPYTFRIHSKCFRIRTLTEEIDCLKQSFCLKIRPRTGECVLLCMMSCCWNFELVHVWWWATTFLPYIPQLPQLLLITASQLLPLQLTTDIQNYNSFSTLLCFIHGTRLSTGDFAYCSVESRELFVSSCSQFQRQQNCEIFFTYNYFCCKAIDRQRSTTRPSCAK